MHKNTGKNNYIGSTTDANDMMHLSLSFHRRHL